MTATEFSDAFDLMYNNISSNAAPGLNEYEKSFFLTKAQEELIKNYFNPKGNKYQEGFDGSAKRQMDFSRLIESSSPVLAEGSNTVFDSRSRTCTLPDDMFIVINEMINLKQGGAIVGTRQVVPIAYDEYMRIMSKPYKEPLKNQAWRLFTGTTTNHTTHTSVVEIILNQNDRTTGIVAEYKVRYVRRPKPIITVNLASAVGNVTINGLQQVSECELDPIMHQEILQRAVELAKATYAADQSGEVQLQNQMTVGQRSE